MCIRDSLQLGKVEQLLGVDCKHVVHVPKDNYDQSALVSPEETHRVEATAHEAELIHLASDVAAQNQWGVGEAEDVAGHLAQRVGPGVRRDHPRVARRYEVDLVAPLAAPLEEA
eukprot:4245441-Pyramimonas_sp.AAC.1